MRDGKLAAFLADAASKPCRMGIWDCGLWLADWYMIATGKPDPASAFRGAAYSDAEIARRARMVIRSIGLDRTRTPALGDVGLISLQKGHLVGGIFTGTHWCILLHDHGVSAIPPTAARFVAAWRVK